MTDPSGPTSTAFRYMSRFRCIGPECEASCCYTWTISIDRVHYERAKSAMRGSAQERQEFDAKVKRVKGPTGSKSRYALIVLQDDGACGFLTPTRLCGLQERYGEEVLSDTCAQYPRVISSSGARFELAGTTSCPEVARQLLLHADALELDEVPPERMSRRRLKQALPDHPDRPYVRYHDELRNLVLDVLSDPRFTLGTRLAVVAYFADRTRPFLHRTAETLDEARLFAEVERIHDPNQRAMLAREFEALHPPPSLAVRIALGFVVRRAPQPLFEDLRLAVLRNYAPSFPDMVTVSSDDFERVGQEILRSYEERKQAFARFAPRIDQSLTNFAKNYWIRHWYFLSPDLLAHTMELLVLLTAVRFLVLGHPLLAEAAMAPGDEGGALVDRALVDAVFRFSRAFEHAPVLLDKLREDLAKNQAISLAHAVSLARF